MIELTLVEYILFWAALVIAFLALRSTRIPPWALFTFNVGFALYWFVSILADGPNVMEVILVIAGVAVAAHIWWRDLRGAARSRRPPGP